MGAVELYGALSRTVKRKFKARATELRASILAMASPPGSGPVTELPAKTVARRGKIRVGLVVAGKDNQFGPMALVGDATELLPVVAEVPASSCSQQ